jgi:hypothetical protein
VLSVSTVRAEGIDKVLLAGTCLPEGVSAVPNHRAFAALDHCKQDGDACSSGIDCCAGARSVSGACAPPPANTCAKRDERCASDANCCHSQNGDCINGFCAYVPAVLR